MASYDVLPGMTFGSDPELFVLNADGEPVGVEDFIPGTKSEPFKVDCGAVQVDGMAAEFNIDPVDNFNDFYHNTMTVIQQLRSYLPAGHTFSQSSKATFSPKEWKKASLGAKMLGCSPDFNAWTGDLNPPPGVSAASRTRYAGGHLHFGWREGGAQDDPEHYLACVNLVKQLDWYLGGWSVRADREKGRREMYGKAGSMRFKPYGVEYRVLSNFWVTSGSKNTMKNVWDRMQAALHKMSQGHTLYDGNYSATFNNRLIESINTGKRDSTLENEFFFPLIGV